MADLTPGRRGDRGQILLIAAFIIAASFVVLALIVNSAIFTENLATRDDVTGSQDALEHRHEVSQSVGEIIETVNEDNSLDTAKVQNTVPNVSVQGGLQQSSVGRVVDVEFASETPGTKIAQDVEREFTSNQSSLINDWTLATDSEGTRNVQFNITEFDDSILSATTVVFTVVINDSDDTWLMSIQRDYLGSGVYADDVELIVDPPNASARLCVREFDEHVTIDVTAATFDGEPCPALNRQTSGTPMWLGAGVEDPHHIQFTGDVELLNGTYSMIVDGTPSDPDNFANDPDVGPYTEDAVYSTNVTYSYYAPAVGYETEIRVAPEEVPP